MQLDDPLAPPARIVCPRRPTRKVLPVVAIVGNHTLTETGEIGYVADLFHKLPAMTPTVFAKQSSADFIGRLDGYFAGWNPDQWQWRAGTYERDIVRPSDNVRVATRVSTIIHYFGWRGKSFHKIIDPVTMYGHRLAKVWPHDWLADDDPLRVLLEWAVCLRDFCHKNGLQLRPTIGGISAQFLTDERFYPSKRRKVPMAINERARQELPGNHYALMVQPKQAEFTAWYLDQHRAHHYHARTTPLPDSNYLYAYGRFTDLAEVSFEYEVSCFYGLYCLDLEEPRRKRRSSWIRKPEAAFVYSNEIQHVLDMGYRIKGIRAAWGSHERDTGLALYAQWAEKQLDYYGDKPWLKPLLLATYGTLAIRAGYRESIFKLTSRGEDVTLITGNRSLNGSLVRTKKKLEPRIANVIHRGMIEAATRSESIGLAQFLSHKGYRVLSIYADAVIVQDEGDKELPILPTPWRCKTTLNHLQFINQQAFVSGEMTKLPGVGAEYRNGHTPLARPLQHIPGE